ncbi:hypothetical protein JOD54_004021 [Actinokineospora baliensis]|nr:hypothetical protein [Actinokineospora baliensis]
MSTSAIPPGSAGPTLCARGRRKDGFCQAVRPELKRCTGFTTGCSGTTRWIGGSARQSARSTRSGVAAGAGLRRHGHIGPVHRPCEILVLIRAISAT